jgi:hypothetical protein
MHYERRNGFNFKPRPMHTPIFPSGEDKIGKYAIQDD